MYPQFVQKVFNYCVASVQSDEVTKYVNDLLFKGYLVKVIVHEPYPFGKERVAYLTTVVATLTDRIDIGFSKKE